MEVLILSIHNFRGIFWNFPLFEYFIYFPKKIHNCLKQSSSLFGHFSILEHLEIPEIQEDMREE